MQAESVAPSKDRPTVPGSGMTELATHWSITRSKKCRFPLSRTTALLPAATTVGPFAPWYRTGSAIQPAPFGRNGVTAAFESVTSKPPPDSTSPWISGHGVVEVTTQAPPLSARCWSASPKPTASAPSASRLANVDSV